MADATARLTTEALLQVSLETRRCPGCRQMTTGQARPRTPRMGLNWATTREFCPGCRDWIVHNHWGLFYPYPTICSPSRLPNHNT